MGFFCRVLKLVIRSERNIFNFLMPITFIKSVYKICGWSSYTSQATWSATIYRKTPRFRRMIIIPSLSVAAVRYRAVNTSETLGPVLHGEIAVTVLIHRPGTLLYKECEPRVHEFPLYLAPPVEYLSR